MSVSFSNHPAVIDVNRGRIECDIMELEYDGELPAGLQGRFYRCGSDARFPSSFPADTPINGDGMVSMFRFVDGHVDLKMRYVETDRLKRERSARRALFGAYRNSYTDAASVAGVDRTLANTAIVWHARRMFALKEDGLPHEFHPDTLATLGKYNFDGRLRSPTFTAHPKTDPMTGELVFFGFEAGGDASSDIAFCTANEKGELIQENWFRAPYASMVHDFAVSENYAIFPIMPTTSDLPRIRAGGAHFAWDESLPTYVAVVPRKGDIKDIRYFKGPARWSFHTMNAFEEGGLLHLDLTTSEINGFAFIPNVADRAWDPQRAQSYLTRWTFDLEGTEETFKERRLWDIPADFLKTDPRHQTRAYRHGWMVGKDESKMGNPLPPRQPFNVIGHIDHKTGVVDTWFCGPDSGLQEPVFAPMPGATEEGAGWLLSVVNRYRQHRADVVVLDALNISAGPIATVKVPLHLPMTFHGEFIAEEEFAGGNNG